MAAVCAEDLDQDDVVFCSQVSETERMDLQDGSPGLVSSPAVQHTNTARKGRSGKQWEIHCPVHEDMELGEEYMQWIDTVPFQRLRELRQLGLASYVFPSANHTRFEHSLGTCHLAHLYAEQILKKQGPELDMSRRDVLCVGLAGLCHDLGHGPFSHAWNRFLDAKAIKGWEHELMSGQLIDFVQDEYHIDSITSEDARLIKALISGKRYKAPHEKGFLFDIVANDRNSIDVDKMDYLMRDAYHCGLSVNKCRMVMSRSKVIDDQICYLESTIPEVLSIFTTRAKMHNVVYTHRKVRSVDLMVVDALVQADVSMQFSTQFHGISMDSCREFITLDDSLLRQIECIKDGDGPVRAAQAILKRLRHRELYVYVNELLVPQEFINNHWKEPSSQDLCSYWHANGEVQLDPEEVVVDVTKINWAKKDRNPLDGVSWFSSMHSTEGVPLKACQLTSMVPGVFQDHKLRVYSKNRDPKVVQAVQAAFERYCTQVFGGQAMLLSACKAGADVCSSGAEEAEARGLSTPKVERHMSDTRPPLLKRRHKASEDEDAQG